MHAAEGILTSRGGMTSHAAVVARGMGKPCVSGAGSCASTRATARWSPRWRNAEGRRRHHHRRLHRPGAARAHVPCCSRSCPAISADHGMGRRNAAHEGARQCRDPADDAPRAISAPRASACAAPSTCSLTATASRHARDDPAGQGTSAPQGARQAAAMQRGLCRAVRDHGGLPVTIRLLDPPLHEFLPHGEDEEIPKSGGRHRPWTSIPESCARAVELHEFNPMLGHRGCRLAVSYPELPRCRPAPSSRRCRRGRRNDRQAGRPGNHGAAGRPSRAELDFVKAHRSIVAEEVIEREPATKIDLSRRHHDRAAARRPSGR
jgi:pyruvate,orthophosphate dikinase